jgi:hypothetical protein
MPSSQWKDHGPDVYVIVNLLLIVMGGRPEPPFLFHSLYVPNAPSDVLEVFAPLDSKNFIFDCVGLAFGWGFASECYFFGFRIDQLKHVSLRC